MHDISVVIPAFNQPQMLSDAIGSVGEQTMPPAEIIVIDDCSDRPLERTTDVSPALPLRFVRQPRNVGPAASVVQGIRESHCELVTTLNHDDVWEPLFLERLSDALADDPDASFAFCDHGVMRADGQHDEHLSREQDARFGRTSLTPGVLAGARLYEAALLDKAVAASSFMLARRQALDLALIAAGGDMWDYFLTVGACRAGGAAVYVGERLGWYRLSPTMLSATWTDPEKQVEMARPETAILMLILLSPQFEPVHRAARMRLVFAMRHALAGAARTRSFRSGGRLAAQIIAGARDAKRLASPASTHRG